MIITKERKSWFIYLADIPYFLNVQKQLNFGALQIYLFSITLQLLHIYLYYKHIYPTFLNPFHMISGLISPKSIGITNRETILKLINRSKFCFLICNLNSLLIIIFGLFALNYINFINI